MTVVNKVEIVREVNEIIVEETAPLVVEETGYRLSLATVGPQGPPGPQGEQGPSGAAGGSVFEYTQSTPAATWTLNHNLGRRVHVSVFNDSNEVVYADIEHGTDDQTTITFAAPITGSAVIS